MRLFERPEAGLGNRPTIPNCHKAAVVIQTKDAAFGEAPGRFENRLTVSPFLGGQPQVANRMCSISAHKSIISKHGDCGHKEDGKQEAVLCIILKQSFVPMENWIRESEKDKIRV